MKVTHSIVEIRVDSYEENQQLQRLLEEYEIPQIWWPSGGWPPYPITYTLSGDNFKKIEGAEILQ